MLAAVLFLTFVQGEYRVDAPFVVQATTQRVISAPFDGILAEVNVKPGSKVIAGETVLASLDTSELVLKQKDLGKERDMHLIEASTARKEGKMGEVQIAQAKAARAQAQLDWVEYQLRQAKITSSITGTVIKGDLTEDVDVPVSKGQELFRVAPIKQRCAELHVRDDRIAEFKVGQTGELATAANPGQYLKFKVTSIDPVAEVIDQQNVFRVHVKLENPPNWLHPGMEGLAKVDAGRASYGWLWTHEAIDWIRMKLWL